MVNRRTFIQQAGLFASGAVVFPAWQAPRRYKIGLQLFTLNSAMNRDPLGTLQRVAAMGYEEVETYGINPDELTYYGMPAGDFARALRDYNLPSPTGHYDFQNLLSADDDPMNRYVDRVTEGAKLLGQQYVVWPYLEPKTRTLDTYKRVAERLNVIGARVSKAGLRVAYHNGGGEFVQQNGQYPYDIILKETDPALVKLQIDLYWFSFDTEQPAHDWFKKAPGRFEMWHVKDMHKVNRRYTELGNGSIDYTRIWPDTAMSGMKHFFVEQGGNFTVDAMQSAADGIAYVKKYLQK
jgi:sugar phosphate isomerase/epimerase